MSETTSVASSTPVAPGRPANFGPVLEALRTASSPLTATELGAATAQFNGGRALTGATVRKHLDHLTSTNQVKLATDSEGKQVFRQTTKNGVPLGRPAACYVLA